MNNSKRYSIFLTKPATATAGVITEKVTRGQIINETFTETEWNVYIETHESGKVNYGSPFLESIQELDDQIAELESRGYSAEWRFSD